MSFFSTKPAMRGSDYNRVSQESNGAVEVSEMSRVPESMACIRIASTHGLSKQEHRPAQAIVQTASKCLLHIGKTLSLSIAGLSRMCRWSRKKRSASEASVLGWV